MLTITDIDHIVLTVKDITTTLEFYESVLGMKPQLYIAQDGSERYALGFGSGQRSVKINLHQVENQFLPCAQNPTTGSADICLLTELPVNQLIDHLTDCNVEIIEGPVSRTGAAGKLLSVYIRDPDDNLVEISRLDTL